MARTIQIPNPNYVQGVRQQTEPQYINVTVSDNAKTDKTDEYSKRMNSAGSSKEKYKKTEDFNYKLPSMNSAGPGLIIKK